MWELETEPEFSAGQRVILIAEPSSPVPVLLLVIEYLLLFAC